MLDPFLTECLNRLDRLLLWVCDAEERRASLLAGDAGDGWDAVRSMARPTVVQLGTPDAPQPSLIPSGGSHPLHRLAAAMTLEPCEAEALIVLLAPHVEPRYSSLYAVLQDDLKQHRPTERVVLSLLARTAPRRRALTASLRPGGRLEASGLVRIEPGDWPPLGRPLSLSEDVLDILLGVARPTVPGAARVTWASGTGDSRAPCQVVTGSGNRERAAERRAYGEVLHVRVGRSSAAGDVVRTAWRIGLGTGALPILDVDALEPRDQAAVGRLAKSLVDGLGGRAWLSCRDPLPVGVAHLETEPASWQQRRAGWIEALGRSGQPVDLELASRLATRHRLDQREIEAAVAGAGSIDEEDLNSAATAIGRRAVRHGIRVPTSRTFDDLVLHDTTRSALERLIFYVRNRDRVGELRGLEARFRLQHGPVAMFSGRSGTGKTLAAEVIAGTLGRPLHVVDLSRLVSKYIGETETHIDEVLDSGERAGAVLFFDEADAMFSTRTDVSSSNDRFANLEVGYLLQRIERHDGLVILATNMRQSIDEAFLRRFQFRIEFPFPQAPDRQRIWELMLPQGVARDDNLDLAALGRMVKLSGGNIRNAALKAIFLAEAEGVALAQRHLEEAVAIELLELGRLSRKTSGPPDRGELIRAFAEQLGDGLDQVLKERFLKEIHIVHGSPTKEAMAGKRPAVNLVLHSIATLRGNKGIRVGFVLSAWSQYAEEEHELLGVLHEAAMSMDIDEVLGKGVSMRVQESHDFDLVQRFWASHDQPIRASIVIDAELGA